MSHVIYTGSNLDVLPTLPDNSIDAIVTDPPYELGFMGKSWDSTGIAYNLALWKECLRVLKPGGHMLAFSGSRTYHRMTCAIEDAGFEVRDQMMWVYGSGFPKSHNISKALDKSNGIERENKFEGAFYMFAGTTGNKKCEKCGKWLKSGSPCQCPRPQDEAKSPEAKQWDGWGTALKPAHEPICLARKPLDGTVADNVIKWGVGGMNIDGCRVGEGKGRFPANLMHDGSQEVLELFPITHGAGTFRTGSSSGNIFPARKGEDKDKQRKAIDDGGSTARFFYCPKASKADRDEGCDNLERKEKPAHMRTGNGTGETSMSDGFQPTQRKNIHPTVKPTELMRYLCRLITPPGGTVLDPFNGSGSTGKAAVLEGFNYIGIEMNPEYVTISEARIKAALER